MGTHKFDKAEYDQKEQDKADAKLNPKSDTLAGLKVRVAALEKLAGVA